MTTTARVPSTKNPSIAYTASIAAGAVGNFIAIGKMEGGEYITFEGSNGAGSIFEPLTYIDGDGNSRPAQLTRSNRTIQLIGPLDLRINKDATANAIEVAQYT
jgi:hypothetical protein